MADTERPMYELEYPAPEMSGSRDSSVTMIVALQGYADAGHAVEAAADHLLAALDNRLVASFNNDELLDYRSRRPSVTMHDAHVSRVESLELGLRVVRDTEGRPFLLLSGPEPDMRWEAFSQAVTDLAEKFGGDKTICLYSAPMSVPHTRPLVVTAHGNFPAIKEKHPYFDSIVHLPGSAQLNIEMELDKRGKKSGGFTAMVPNYVSGSLYPAATLNLLRSVEGIADLKLPLHVLERDAAKVEEQLYEQTAENSEIMTVVLLLERQYDERLAEFKSAHPGMALPGEASLPTPEELGEAFEQYLASIDDSASLPSAHEGLPPQPGGPMPGTTDPREALNSLHSEPTAEDPTSAPHNNPGEQGGSSHEDGPNREDGATGDHDAE